MSRLAGGARKAVATSVAAALALALALTGPAAIAGAEGDGPLASASITKQQKAKKLKACKKIKKKAKRQKCIKRVKKLKVTQPPKPPTDPNPPTPPEPPAPPTLPEGTTYDVGVKDDFYDPAALTIKAGDLINWVWDDENINSHNVKLAKGPAGVTPSTFTSAATGATGITFKRQFVVTGDYELYCTVHSSVMRMNVKVE